MTILHNFDIKNVAYYDNLRHARKGDTEMSERNEMNENIQSQKSAQVLKGDPYKKLIWVTILLCVLFVGLLVGHRMLSSTQDARHRELQNKILEENNQLIAQYNEKVLERNKLMSQTQEIVLPEPAQEGWDIIDASNVPVKGGQAITTTRLEALSGGLLLLNRWHSLPSDFIVAEQGLKSVGTETSFKVPVANRSVSLFPEAINALSRFVNAAKEQGLEHYIVRQGYRTMETQTKYWNTETARHPNREGDGLIEAARQNVSYPGTSDYQSGFSFEMDVYNKDDSVINTAKFQETEQAAFLNAEGWKYGIVFRFPTIGYPTTDTIDKSYVTGLNSKLKMNAYRYVGVPHATVMHIKGFVLEEYIDYLIKTPHILVYENGNLRYEIYRIPETGSDQTHNIPTNAVHFFVSTDNMGGLVCAITY